VVRLALYAALGVAAEGAMSVSLRSARDGGRSDPPGVTTWSSCRPRLPRRARDELPERSSPAGTRDPRRRREAPGRGRPDPQHPGAHASHHAL